MTEVFLGTSISFLLQETKKQHTMRLIANMLVVKALLNTELQFSNEQIRWQERQTACLFTVQ